ncbi:MAG TPA: DoxX family protein [Gemmataceae bacterium]|nr:DoxX family protein [Gemmataceae bacterium]
MTRWLYPYGTTQAASLGLLALRIVVGAAFIQHGWGKIQHPTDWQQLGGMPNPDVAPLQVLAALAEFGGGIALVLGLLTPLAALGILVTMLVAIFKVLPPWRVPFVNDPGKPSYELNLVYVACTLVLMLAGPGRFSLDALLAGRRRSPAASVDPTGRGSVC